MRNRRFLSFLLASVLLAGCASLPANLGRDEASALAEARGQPVPKSSDSSADQLIAELTKQALTRESAVRIALANSPRLRTEYARLGITAAEVYDAGRLSNPTLSAAWLNSNEPGAADQVSYGLAQSFTDILLLGARRRLAKGEFERAKLVAGDEIQSLAAQVESAYFSLVGAKQVAAMRVAVAQAAKVSADLAQRFFDAGNISRLELAREQAAASQAELERIEAEGAVVAGKAELNRLLGLTHNQAQWQVVEQLPLPVPREDDLQSLLALAGKSRLDFEAQRVETELLADSLGVTRRYRWLGSVEIGVETERETDRSRLTGPTLALELPIFNQGQGAVTRVESQLQQAEAQLRALQVDISNAVQLAHADLLKAKSRADHYRSALIPQREQIVARTLEEVNFMLLGQFELLLAKQQEYDAYQGYLEALRDYWLARVELARQVGNRLPSDAQISAETLDVRTLIAPKDSGMGQMHHGDMPDGEMRQMDHSDDGARGKQEQMDHSGHGAQPAAPAKADPHAGHRMAPKEPAPPKKPPPPAPAGKHEGHSDMPTGMESHIPKPAAKGSDKPAETEKQDTPEHGEHQ